MRAGLLGRKLGHSFSPRIHARFGDYGYDLFEVEPDGLDAFMKSDRWDALNVTIPYKRDVIPYCAELSPAARAIGSVNTLVRRADGAIFGDNTDAAGLRAMMDALNISARGKKALVLGSGGASLTARHVLEEAGAEPVVVVSRSGPDNYENLSRHADARILVNTTPVGMYPNCPAAPLKLESLPALEAVLDVVYNPARTGLLMDAQSRNIPCVGGLRMLVEQARAASERFTGQKIPRARAEDVLRELRRDTMNIIVAGMPGSGKTTVARLIAERTGRTLVDTDELIVEAVGCSIPEYFQSHTEAEFRAAESEAIARAGRGSGLVIATGGGCVTRSENYAPLHQNGAIFFLRRALSLLPTDGRPLSQRNSLEALYAARLPLYRAFADAEIENMGAPEDTAARILEVYDEISGA